MSTRFRLAGCRAVITGASSGLGAEFARQLAPHAAALVLVARRGDALAEVRRSLPPGPATVLDCAADLATDAGRATLGEFLDRHAFRPNLLVNNAGLGDYGRFDTAPTERSRAVLDLNVTALTLLTRDFLDRLDPPAGILQVSSLASSLPIPELAVYAASKAYVTSLSESLALELAPRDVTVTCLCPGPTPTGFSAAARRDDGPDTNRAGTGPLRMAPAAVVAAGLAGLATGRPCVHPGRRVAFAATLFRLLPRPLLRGLLRRRLAASGEPPPPARGSRGT